MARFGRLQISIGVEKCGVLVLDEQILGPSFSGVVLVADLGLRGGFTIARTVTEAAAVRALLAFLPPSCVRRNVLLYVEEGRVMVPNSESVYWFATKMMGENESVVDCLCLGFAEPALACFRSHALLAPPGEVSMPGLNRKAGPGKGLTVVTSSSLTGITVNEGADPTVRVDLLKGLQQICVERSLGPVPLLSAALLGHNVALMDERGSVSALGTWQAFEALNWTTTSDPQVFIYRLSAHVMDRETFNVQLNRGRCCVSVYNQIHAVFKNIPRVRLGFLHLFILHTSASLAILHAENLEREESELDYVVPTRWNDEFFIHTYEGSDDMPGHLKCSIVGCSVVVPILAGKLIFESAQVPKLLEGTAPVTCPTMPHDDYTVPHKDNLPPITVAVCEHRSGRRTRKVTGTLYGIDSLS